MARLEVFDIRRKPQLFAWHVDCFDCNYHIEKSKSSLKIYAEYNIILAAQHLYLFELINRSDGFTLKFFSEHDVDAFFVGNDKEKVINSVIDKIIEKTTFGESWVERKLSAANKNPFKKDEYEKEVKDFREMIEMLKKILREKLEEFIG